jgi:hypothetical protein
MLNLMENIFYLNFTLNLNNYKNSRVFFIKNLKINKNIINILNKIIYKK